ncbi:hypothetical protein ACOSP7_010405 [Xanthoceras sorbifolium]
MCSFDVPVLLTELVKKLKGGPRLSSHDHIYVCAVVFDVVADSSPPLVREPGTLIDDCSEVDHADGPDGELFDYKSCADQYVRAVKPLKVKGTKNGFKKWLD